VRSVLSMKVLSYNARGLGGGEKRAEVRKLVQDRQPMVLCLQETKWQVVTESMINNIWGDAPRDFSFCRSVGASGGLVTVWDTSRIVVWSSMCYGNVLVIKGKVISSDEEFMIFNVYAPCDLAAKREMWGTLKSKVLNNNDVNVCVCGDFNSVRGEDERKGRCTVYRQADASAFNDFIDSSYLIDLPICGRLFTWYKGDGVSMSRLDRFLLSEKWSETWPNSTQIA
jgi:exonuclease III